MKKHLFYLFIVILPLFSFSSLDGKFYVGGLAGVNFVNDDLDDFDIDYDVGYALTLHGGYQFSNCIDLELEGCFRHNSIDDIKFLGLSTSIGGDLEVWTIFINSNYRLPQYWCIQPYIGAGIGWSFEKIELSSQNLPHTEETDNGFAYQIICGLSYPLLHCFEVSLDYRYTAFEEHARAHTVGLQLIRTF